MRHVYVIGEALHLTSPHGTPLASRDWPGPSPLATERDALTVTSLGFCQQNSSLGTLLLSTSPAPGRQSYVPPAPTSPGRGADSLQRPCEAVGVGAVDKFGCIAFESRGVCRRTT